MGKHVWFLASIALLMCLSARQAKADIVEFQDYCDGCDGDKFYPASQFGGLVNLSSFVHVRYANHPVPPGYPTVSRNSAEFFFCGLNLTGEVIFDLGDGSSPISQPLLSVVSGEYFTKQHYDLMHPGVFALTISVNGTGNEEFHDGYGARLFAPYSIQHAFTDTVTIPSPVPGPFVGAGLPSLVFAMAFVYVHKRKRRAQQQRQAGDF